MNLFAAWRKRREHNRKMKHFFTLLEEETQQLANTWIELAEVYADAARMAQQSKENTKWQHR